MSKKHIPVISPGLRHTLIWEGPGWYADLGRTDSDREAYIEGRMIAAADEYDQDGFSPDGKPIWFSSNTRGRGTPYWLASQPE